MIEISNAELKVMQVLWQRQPLSANDVVAALADDKDWHEKTVKTLLNRLVSKGALGFDKDGRAYLAYHNYQTLMHWNRSYYFVSSVGYLADLIDKG